MTRQLHILIVVLASFLVSTTVFSQTSNVAESAILTVESDRLFAESEFGLRVGREIEAAQSILLAENRKIEAELTAEEKALTEKRKQMTAQDFRAVADAFDVRVQDIRRIQDTKAGKIEQLRDQEQVAFINATRPILVELMQGAGASVIMERRTVLASNDAIDITDRAIARLNLAIGDGAGLRQSP